MKRLIDCLSNARPCFLVFIEKKFKNIDNDFLEKINLPDFQHQNQELCFEKFQIFIFVKTFNCEYIALQESF